MSYARQEEHPESLVVCRTAVQAAHLTNLTACPSCVITYCQSCSYGCPKCGWGRQVDRRQAERRQVQGTVFIQPEEEQA